MPSTLNSFSSSCFEKPRKSSSDTQEEKKIFKTKVDILNCKPEDVKLKMEGNRVIIEGKLYKNNKNKEKPVYFSKHYIMPENCELNKMKYTITPDGVFITAPRRDRVSCSDWPTLEENCTSNCVDLKDRFEIRLNVKEFHPDDIKIKVNGNTIIIKAKHLQETGMKRVIKTYSLPENCEITKLERKFTPQGYLLLSVPKFLGLFYDSKNTNSKSNNEKVNNVKCKFNITTEKFEIKIDVTNFKPEDINIIQQKRMITIEGKRSKKSDNISEKFEKTFVLPSDYDISRINRKFHADGVLVISVPRIEGKPVEDFKTFLPENSICDMQIKDGFVEIKLDIVGYSPEEIMVKITGKNTLTLEGKQIGGKGRVNKSFMKSYMLPSECDTNRIKKHITSNGVLIVRIPTTRKTSSLENLTDLDGKIFSNRTKNGSLDNLSDPDQDEAMVDSAELDKEKFEMKFNVQGFQTEDIYVKINKNIVTIDCRHSQPGRGIIKSYLVPKTFDLSELKTFITQDDILVVTIPRFKSQRNEPLLNSYNNKEFDYNRDNITNKFNSEKIGDNYVIKVDIRGYNNNDISLDIKGRNIIVQGGHLGNKLISKSFSKNFNVPPGFNVENLIYYISAGGFLVIEIPKDIQSQQESTSYSFPNAKGSSISSANGLEQYKKMNSEIPQKSPRTENAIEYKEYKKPDNFNYSSPKLKKHNHSTVPDGKRKKISTKNEVIILNDKNREVFHIRLDVTECKEKDINVRIKGHNLTVEGKKENNDSDDSNTLEDFQRSFVVPEEFNLKEIKTNIQDGILFIYIPKFKPQPTHDEVVPNGREILSNVKIGQESILVEMDASGLRIEDFEITTNKNILTIEVSKLGQDKYKTKVDLPQDAIIDEILKEITSEGKLLVTIPRKIEKFVEEKIQTSSESELDENVKFIQAEKKRSSMVISKTRMGEKSKSVKFLVDEFQTESDGATKFATLPRSVRSRSYNSLYQDQSDRASVVDDFELKIFVPHHEPDEVIVKVRGDTVTIEGQKKNDKGNTYFSKNFFKTYIVPKNVDASQLKTTFTDNYLLVTAPKRNEEK